MATDEDRYHDRWDQEEEERYQARWGREDEAFYKKPGRADASTEKQETFAPLADGVAEAESAPFGLCNQCNTPLTEPPVCGSKTQRCPMCGYPWPAGDCSD